ncbi:MAG: hypothetical protein AAGA61_06005 [Pseudomonadota bacterium]
MTEISLVEWLGYAASALVLISLSMSSIAKLRWFNLCGASAFAVYGYLINAWPVTLMNTAIAGVNIYYLLQLYTRKDDFKALPIGTDDAYLQEFLAYHRDDIRRWYPTFDTLPNDALVLLVLRNLAVAGVLVLKDRGDRTTEILVDYVIPEYADRKVGRFLFYQNRVFFRDRNFDRVIIDGKRIRNQGYFDAMGFRADENEEWLLELVRDSRMDAPRND